jgi:hypothetical protein
LISDINWVPGQVVANLVVVAAGPTNTAVFYNNAGNVDIVIDMEGTYSTTPTAAVVRSAPLSTRRTFQPPA